MRMIISPRTAALVRKDYLAGKSVREICARRSVSRHALYLCVDGVAVGLPPMPRQRKTTGGRPLRLTGEREGVVKRLWLAAERHVRILESRLIHAQKPSERERDARLMAVLVKTLGDLSALDNAGPSVSRKKGAAKSTSGPEHHDDAADNADTDGPKDIDEFRRELARRLASLADGEATATAGPTDSAGA
jgi:hypothetical protein